MERWRRRPRLRADLPLLLLLSSIFSACMCTADAIENQEDFISPAELVTCVDYVLMGDREPGAKMVGLSTRRWPVWCRPARDPALPTIFEVTTALQSPVLLDGRRRTVGFQVIDVDVLRALILRSSKCSQEVNVRWPDWPVNASSFEIESLTGNRREITPPPVEPSGDADAVVVPERDGASIDILLKKEEVGILHLLPRDEHRIIVSASAIRCEQTVDDVAEVFPNDVDLEINFHHDSTSRAGGPPPLLSFAIRSDRDGPIIHFEGIDKGYSDDASVFLSDFSSGLWNTVFVSLRNLTIWVDDGRGGTLARWSPQIGQEVRSLSSIRLVGDGLKAKIRLDGAPVSVQPLQSSRRERPVCSIFSSMQCEVQSAFYSHQRVASVDTGSVSFNRHTDVDSLVMVVDSSRNVFDPVALQFRSDSERGLLVYRKAADGGGLVQVHYSGRRLVALICSGNPRYCALGTIHSPASTLGDGRWHVVALKPSEPILSLDGRPTREFENRNVDQADLYNTNGNASLLFVGGVVRKSLKGYSLEFANQNRDPTFEKPPSFRGCVRALFLNGRPISLADQLASMLDVDQFAVSAGCPSCDRCPESIACRPASSDPRPDVVCDCAAKNLYLDEESGCRKTTVPPLLLAQESTLFERTFPLGRRRKSSLTRAWFRLRLPTANLEPHMILELYSIDNDLKIRISASKHGRRATVEWFLAEGEEKGKGEVDVDPDDARLRLVTLERSDAKHGTGAHRHWTISLDSASWHFETSDMGVASVAVYPLPRDTPVQSAGYLQDVGLAYDVNERDYYMERSNRVADLNVLALIYSAVGTDPWFRVWPEDELLPGVEDDEGVKSGSAPSGVVFDYSPTGMPIVYKGSGSNWHLALLIPLIFACLVIILLATYISCYKSRSNEERRRRVVLTRRSKDEEKPMLSGSNTLASSMTASPGVAASQQQQQQQQQQYSASVHSPLAPILVSSGRGLEKVYQEPPPDTPGSVGDCESDSRNGYDEPQTRRVKVDRDSIVTFIDPPVIVERSSYASVIARRPPSELLTILREPAPLAEQDDESAASSGSAAGVHRGGVRSTYLAARQPEPPPRTTKPSGAPTPPQHNDPEQLAFY